MFVTICVYKRHIKTWENSVLFRSFHFANERERSCKRLHCSPYAKKKRSLRYGTLRLNNYIFMLYGVFHIPKSEISFWSDKMKNIGEKSKWIYYYIKIWLKLHRKYFVFLFIFLIKGIYINWYTKPIQHWKTWI